MILKGFEWGMLRELIGKKAEAIIIPNAPNTVSEPVEAILLMSNKKGIVIDSCFRDKKPTEIPENYPQMRIRELDELPAYLQQQRIELGKDGEIVRRVLLVNEELKGSHGNVEYSRAIHIDFTGEKEASFIRGSHATPGMKISMEEDWRKDLGETKDYRQIIAL